MLVLPGALRAPPRLWTWRCVAFMPSKQCYSWTRHTQGGMQEDPSTYWYPLCVATGFRVPKQVWPNPCLAGQPAPTLSPRRGGRQGDRTSESLPPQRGSNPGLADRSAQGGATHHATAQPRATHPSPAPFHAKPLTQSLKKWLKEEASASLRARTQDPLPARPAAPSQGHTASGLTPYS